MSDVSLRHRLVRSLANHCEGDIVRNMDVKQCYNCVELLIYDVTVFKSFICVIANTIAMVHLHNLPDVPMIIGFNELIVPQFDDSAINELKRKSNEKMNNVITRLCMYYFLFFI